MKRSDRGTRGGAVLAILALGTLAVTPAMSAFNPTKGKIKKLATKQATMVLNTQGPGQFIQEGELVRWGPFNMSLGQTQPIGTFGPFTLEAVCRDDDAGAGTDIAGEVPIKTSEANSIMYTNEGFDDDFDPGDTPLWAGEVTGESLGDGPNSFDYYPDSGIASAPSGASITGGTYLHTNFDGSACVLVGYVMQLAPR